MNDLSFSFRQFLKNPGFTAVSVLTLALGIGATTTVFSLVDAVLLKPLPYDQPGQLVQVWEAPAPGQRNWASPGAFLDWKEHGNVFVALLLSGVAVLACFIPAARAANVQPMVALRHES